MIKYLSPLVSCLECREVKSAKGIFSHFITAHTEAGQSRCKQNGLNSGETQARKTISKVSRENRIAKEENYNNDPKICSQCGDAHLYQKRNNKFCSQSCGAIYCNLSRSSDIREAQKASLVEFNRLNPRAPIKKTNVFFQYCVMCLDVIKNKNKKTCQAECRTKLNVKNGTISGRKSAAKRVRRSKDEIALSILCESHFTHVTNNDNQIANGWDADILIHDIKTAILWNGPWHYKEMGFSNHSLSQVQNRDAIKIKEFTKAGWKVLVFEDRNYTPRAAFDFIISHN